MKMIFIFKGETVDGLFHKTAAGDFKLPAPKSCIENLKPYQGKTVHLGIRPSDLAIDENGAIHAHVESIEPLGDAHLMYVRIGDRVVIVKHAQEEAPTQKALRFSPNTAKLHLFDTQSEARINV